jgi:hypothetical protein
MRNCFRKESHLKKRKIASIILFSFFTKKIQINDTLLKIYRGSARGTKFTSFCRSDKPTKSKTAVNSTLRQKQTAVNFKKTADILHPSAHNN